MLAYTNTFVLVSFSFSPDSFLYTLTCCLQSVLLSAGLLVARVEAAAAAQPPQGMPGLLPEAEKYKAALLMAVREKQVGRATS